MGAKEVLLSALLNWLENVALTVTMSGTEDICHVLLLSLQSVMI